ncbi:MAG TPA: sulfite exporter TauE/SafE family protein [Bacteroidales bacterium]|nr:sulfite exporter TauE/SafE family protein [Bacteroidales bacterium]HRX97833.1 sulfite exporter TauE/SafE family protein [Bacteroidales bacterium]
MLFPQDIILLAGTAATVGIVHTALGPDHYLPFIFLAKARNWSVFKTSWITILCGIGHVGSSVLLGVVGFYLSIELAQLELIEGVRGNLAAWAFVIFGLGYFIWGLYRSISNKPHKHKHFHDDGTIHVHEHHHKDSHDHTHKKNITPWILFLIFVLGPCEPLIPILMYPAAESSTSGMIFIAMIFSLVTIITMLGIVLMVTFGLNTIKLGKLERHTHALAGLIVLLSGIAILMGL